MDFLNFASDLSAVDLAFRILAIVSTALAVHQSFKKPYGKIKYQYSESKLLGGGFAEGDDIQLYFKDKRVPRVSETEIIVWNGGSKEVRQADIFENAPLVIRAPEDGRILKAEVVRSTDRTSKVELKPVPDSSNQVKLEFLCLNPRDAAHLRIIHTGVGGRPSISGRLKGPPRSGIEDCGSVISFKFAQRPKNLSFANRVVDQIIPSHISVRGKWVFIFLVITGVIGIVTSWFLMKETDHSLIVDAYRKGTLVMMFYGLSFIALPIAFIFSQRRKYYNRVWDDQPWEGRVST